MKRIGHVHPPPSPKIYTPGATLLKYTSCAQVAKHVEDRMGVQREEMEESWDSKLKREAMIWWKASILS